MNTEQRQAYGWAKTHDYPSIAARHARALASAVDDLQSQLAASRRRERAAVEDLYTACRRSPCNSGICVKKNCAGNIIPCKFEWRGPQEAGEGGQDE